MGDSALIENVVSDKNALPTMTCLEPACGRGHMAVALAPYFKEITASDIFDYGFGRVADFFKAQHSDQSFDWVITNPPFRLGEQFIGRSMAIARRGVAMLTRTVFIESVGRYERLFKTNPPSRFAQFTERVPMVKGRVDKKASTATGYLGSFGKRIVLVRRSWYGYQRAGRCSNAKITINKHRACPFLKLLPKSFR